MRPALFTVDLPGPGRLSTMARPRGNDWLEDEMIALNDYGTDVLVSALTGPSSTSSASWTNPEQP
ncbi:hypothetical protein [Streptomyces sp. NPDC003023]|uniref:hypothetical protein n=1 Tax=Streptomyces sp. NPDC003023 TaxID=3364675 RepID=UPI0036C4CF23